MTEYVNGKFDSKTNYIVSCAGAKLILGLHALISMPPPQAYAM